MLLGWCLCGQMVLLLLLLMLQRLQLLGRHFRARRNDGRLASDRIRMRMLHQNGWGLLLLLLLLVIVMLMHSTGRCRTCENDRLLLLLVLLMLRRPMKLLLRRLVFRLHLLNGDLLRIEHMRFHRLRSRDFRLMRSGH